MKRLITNCLGGFAVLALLLLPLATHAVGVSPGKLTVKNVRNGIAVQEQIRITRPGNEGALLFEVSAKGTGSEYVRLSEDVFRINDGSPFGTYTFEIAPDTAPNGTYEVHIHFVGVADASAGVGTGTQIQSGATLKLLFTVTDDVFETFEITQAYFEETEIGLPAALSFEVDNTGNVDARVGDIEVVVYDKLHKNEVARTRVDGSTAGIIDPLEKGFLVAAVEGIELPAAAYDADVTFFDRSGDGGVLRAFTGISYRIHPVGTLSQEVTLAQVRPSSDTVSIGRSIKFVANIQNTGAILTSAHVLFDLYDAAGELITTVETNQVALPKGKSTTLEASYAPTIAGVHRVVAKAAYGPFVTDTVEFEFEAQESLFAGASWLAIAGIALGACILVLLLVIVVLLAKKKKTV